MQKKEEIASRSRSKVRTDLNHFLEELLASVDFAFFGGFWGLLACWMVFFEAILEWHGYYHIHSTESSYPLAYGLYSAANVDFEGGL